MACEAYPGFQLHFIRHGFVIREAFLKERGTAVRDTHGGNIYDYNKIIYDFSSNVNPLGMPKGAIQVIREQAEAASKYPDMKGSRLRQQISLHDGVAVSHIVLGNGAAELIYGICNGLRPERCLVMAPTFSEYEAAIQAFGCKLSRMRLKAEEDFHMTRHEMSDLFLWIRKTTGRRVLFFCNPNNPTGVLMEKQHLLRIADICEQEGVYLCVDECFLPFLKEEAAYSLKTEVQTYPHLIIIRAFTKFYAMPGLRLGYVLTSNEELLKGLHRVLPPWNTSFFAQLAGVEALQDEAYEHDTIRLVEEERSYLLEEMKNGLVKKVFPPSVNFLFFKAEDGLMQTLLQSGILIRDCRDYVNLEPGYYRIAVRTHEENVAFIHALKKRLEQKGIL